MIPEKSLTKIAAVRLPNVIHQQPAFSGLPRKYTEKVFDSLGYKFDLRVCIKNFPEEKIISSTGNFEDLDFSGRLLEESIDEVNFVITRGDRLDGFLVWLTLHTMPGVVIDVLEHEHCWLPIFVPVFYPGIDVSKGDKIEATCVRTLCENQINPDFTLKGVLKREGREDIEFDYDLAHFEKNYRGTHFYRRLFEESSTKEIEMAQEDKPLDVSSLRKFLENRLPDYMIPGYFKKIDKI
ncbi:MAG: hypothetical protein GY940_12330, partial [bacterium]|nr:hypothetical protein [bacterium]